MALCRIRTGRRPRSDALRRVASSPRRRCEERRPAPAAVEARDGARISPHKTTGARRGELRLARARAEWVPDTEPDDRPQHRRHNSGPRGIRAMTLARPRDSPSAGAYRHPSIRAVVAARRQLPEPAAALAV